MNSKDSSWISRLTLPSKSVLTFDPETSNGVPGAMYHRQGSCAAIVLLFVDVDPFCRTVLVKESSARLRSIVARFGSNPQNQKRKGQSIDPS